MSAPTPPLIIEAFGKDAVDPDFINLIPTTTADPGRASLSLGFPPRTMQPVIAGGTPPFGQDMNGILFMLSSHTVYQQAGTPYYYNSTLSTALGGYALGTLLGMSDGSGFWINRTPNNTTDPDAGGAGWVPLYSYGETIVTGLTGGVLVLSAAQAKKKFIVLAGTLVGNQQIILPARSDDWLIANLTTGNFVLTVKTQSGTGVVIPQGGRIAPVGVWGDGTNIYPTVAPLSVPISQAADPLTLVQRTNAGYVLANRFAQTVGDEGLAGLTSVYVGINDAFIYRTSIANFAAQVSVAAFNGQVANGQVPFSAVLQYAAALFSSPALTGAPTAPTRGVGNNSTALATTQFVMSQALGNAQAWVDVSGSRALNTPYTNTTGRAIQIGFSGDCRRASAGGGAFQAVVNGVQVGSLLAAGSTDLSAAMSFVVPPGATYSVAQSGAYNGYVWSELS